MAVLNRGVAGIPSTTGIRIAVNTTTATSVRIKAGTNTGLTTGVVWGAAMVPDANSNSQLSITGLTANTVYYYRIAMTDGTEALDTWPTVGEFKTDVAGAMNFSFAFGACCNNLDSTAFGAIATKNPDLFFHLGDEYYFDGSGTGLANFRAKMDQRKKATNQMAIYRTSGSCLVPSDHDGMNNNTNAGLDATAWTNYNTAYREFNPTDGIPVTTGLYRTFKRGRVRFIAIERRSFATTPSATDNSSKTSLGATQKQWFKDQITNAAEPVIVVLNPEPWIGGAQAGDDGWFGYITERDELANFISASGKNVLMIAGDMHALAAEDGSASPGGVPIFQAAPFDNNSSIKGGPYDVGPYPSSGTNVVQQYGWVDVTDSGSTISVVFRGFSADNTQRVTLTKTYSVPSTVPAPGDWTLSFSDDFDGTTLDAAKWASNWYGEGGTMNNVGTYARNVAVSGGNVNLTLESSSAGALIHTDIVGGYRFPVGAYVEARILFPGGATCYNWPAWWASSTAADGWPSSGEHDIAEVLSGQLTVNYHSPSGAHNQGAVTGTWGGAFHTYGLHRKNGSADVYWDGILVKTYTTDDSGNPEILILNHGSGGTGSVGAVMQVDYVRAYALTTSSNYSGTLPRTADGIQTRSGVASGGSSFSGSLGLSAFGRTALTPTGQPVGPERLADFRNSANGNIAVLVLDPNGKLGFVDAAGASLTNSVAGATFPTAEWVRVEIAATVGTTTSNGRVEYAYYLGDSQTPLATYDSGASVNTGTQVVNYARLGRDTTGTVARPLSYDDIQAEARTSGWIGPSVAPPADTLALSGSGTLLQTGSAGSIFSPERLADFRNSSAGDIAVLVLDPGGKLSLKDTTGATVPGSVAASAFPADSWVRVEIAATVGTTTSNGRVEYAYYLGDSLTPLGTFDSGPSMNTGQLVVNYARLGRDIAGTVSRAMFYDDIQALAKASGWIGPSVAAPTGSVSHSASGTLARVQAPMSVTNARQLSGAGTLGLVGAKITGGSIAASASGTLAGAGSPRDLGTPLNHTASGTLGLEPRRDFSGALALSGGGSLTGAQNRQTAVDVLALSADGNHTSIVEALHVLTAATLSMAGSLVYSNFLTVLRGPLALAATTATAEVSPGSSGSGHEFLNASGSLSRAGTSSQPFTVTPSAAGALALTPTRLVQTSGLNLSATGTQAQAGVVRTGGSLALAAGGVLTVAGSAPRVSTIMQAGGTATLTGDALVTVSGSTGLGGLGRLYRLAANASMGSTDAYAVGSLSLSRRPQMKQGLGRAATGLLAVSQTRQTVTHAATGLSGSGALSLAGAVLAKTFRSTVAALTLTTPGPLAVTGTLNRSGTGRAVYLGRVMRDLELYTNSGALTLAPKKIAHAGVVALNGSGTQTRPFNNPKPRQLLLRTVDASFTAGTVIATAGRVSRTGTGGLARLLDSMTVEQLLGLTALSGPDWTFVPEENAGTMGLDVYCDLRLRWFRGRMKGRIMPSPYHTEMFSARRRVQSE